MNTRKASIAAVLAVCLAVSLAAGGATAQADPAVGFGDATVVGTQGDVVTVDVRLRNTDEASLRVRAADRSYMGDIALRDGNDDGTVRVRINTFRGVEDPSRETAVSAADGNDSASLVSESTEAAGPTFDAGRYNLIVSTEGTSVAAVLRLEDPEVNGSATRAVAPGTPFPAADDAGWNASIDAGGVDGNGDADADGNDVEADGDADDPPTTVAVGDDARSRFAVSGLGGILESDPPAKNLVFATDSSPGASTTHTVATAPGEELRLRSVTIDYRTMGGEIPPDIYRLLRGDIEALGIDETGDGTVDRSLRIAIANIRTSTDGTVTVAFDRTVTLDANDTLIAAYAVTNPETTGPEDVSVTLEGTRNATTDHGTVLYGPAGQGTLGYGVDFRLEPDAESHRSARVAPLAGVDVAYDASAGAVVTNVDTDRVETGTYTARLTVGEDAPAVYPRTTMTERIEVTEPRIEFVNRSVPDDPTLTVAADTNLAPGNQLVVRVDAEEPGGGVSQVSNCVTEVAADGTLGCEFDLTNPASDFRIEVSVQRDDAVIAGPTRFN